MSWIDQALDNIIIVTGDGKEYKPLWREPQKAIEFNVAQFEFPGVAGSLVSRGTPKGRKFPLEIYFVGENHIIESTRFETSCNDKRHWVVTHPYYGVLNVHPTTINIDNTGGNVSKITINLIETIVENNPKGIETPTDKIFQDSDTFSDRMNDAVVTTVPAPSTLDKNVMTSNVSKIYKEGNKKIKNSLDAESYLNAFNKANAFILRATDDVSKTMTTIQAMINAPFQFIDSVKNRINMLKNQFNKLIGSIENVAKLFVRHTEKRIYEHNAALIIISMAKASVKNIDYKSSEEVLSVVDTLLQVHSDFIDTLDVLQTENGGEEDSYIPDADSMVLLQQIVNYTASKLLEITLDSKQERTIILEKDSNIVILAHRFYGLKVDDSTIEYLINTNNFGMNDLVQISAGRKIKYYV